jgi:hypothetical protein
VGEGRKPVDSGDWAEVIHPLRVRVRASASGAPSMRSTLDAQHAQALRQASATPLLSGMITTRLARSSFTPVGLQT